LRAKKSYPKLLLALDKIATPCCFVMSARIAATDPFKQINEYVGSGPLRFVRNEWVPGACAVFERFPDYVPGPEPASWLAGGKRIVVERIGRAPDPALPPCRTRLRFRDAAAVTSLGAQAAPQRRAENAGFENIRGPMDLIHISKLCVLHLAYSVSRPRNLYTTVLHWLGLARSTT
jgi:ABC-type transport system substrate-binding protein